jgi:hypothetical protein
MKLTKCKIIFEPRDLWIGIYWNYSKPWKGLDNLFVYICVVPMFPIFLSIETCPCLLRSRQVPRQAPL